MFFLSHFVRLTDEPGQTVLRHMWKRPIDAPAVDEILAILNEKCTFKDTWDDLDDPCVMRVFGKRKAEQREFESHIQRVRNSGTAFKVFEATDEICLCKSSVWNETNSPHVSSHLNDKVNEPKQLILYPKALVRVTVNLESQRLSQGQVGVIHEVPSGDAVTIYIQDSSGGEVGITPEMLEHEEYLTWWTVTLTKQTGFVQPFKKNSIRRTQIPLMNFVAWQCTNWWETPSTNWRRPFLLQTTAMHCGWHRKSSSLWVEWSSWRTSPLSETSQLHWEPSDQCLKIGICVNNIFWVCWTKLGITWEMGAVFSQSTSQECHTSPSTKTFRKRLMDLCTYW